MLKHAVAMCNFWLARDLPSVVSFAAEAGYDGVEVWCDAPFCQVDEFGAAERAKLLEQLTESGLCVCGHAPFLGINLGCVNVGVRRECVRQTAAAAKMIGELGGSCLVAHSGKSPDDSPAIRRSVLGLTIDSLKAVAEAAARENVEILLENVGLPDEAWEKTLDDFLLLRDKAGLRTCLDVGHAGITWGLEKTLQALRSSIAHVHVHDNRGVSDDHLVIGDGGIMNFSPLLSFLEDFTGIVTHEIQAPGEADAASRRSLSRLRDMLENQRKKSE